MKDDQADTLRAVLMAEAASRAGEHPEIDLLTSYHHGTLETAAEEQVRDHLVACRDCAERLLELEPLMRPEAAPAVGVADLEIESAWRRFRGPAGAAVVPPGVAGRPQWAMALAASLALATLALGIWSFRLQRANSTLQLQVAEVSAPAVNLPLFYLDGVTRAAAGEAGFEVPAEAGYFVLVFGVAAATPAEEYEVQFLDPEGALVLELRGLVMSDSGGLRLGLPRRLLPPGEYSIRLRGLAGGTWRTVGEYRRRISYAEGAGEAVGVDGPQPAD